MGLIEERVVDLRSATRPWHEALEGPEVPEPHSSLASDDVACPPLPCSRIAWHSLLGAVAAFDRVLDALESPDADGATVLGDLRTALVHASHAVVVLALPRRERTDFAMRIAWSALDGAPDDPGVAALVAFPIPLAAREISRLLAARSFKASPRWTDRASVRVAGDHVAARVPDRALFEDVVRFVWAADSGAGILRDDLVTSAESVRVVVDRAVTLWRTRRLAPPQAAAPATTDETPFGTPTLLAAGS
ncbi:hypothetical protein [Nocardioides daphniae]|nr:hypothetical protein [Nocardioides daphniae]QCC77351.1 hypothetical protein E2C04_09450 [Nocardioides daphniae]